MTGRLPFTAWEIAALGKVLQIPPERYGEFFFEEPLTGQKGA